MKRISYILLIVSIFALSISIFVPNSFALTVTRFANSYGATYFPSHFRSGEITAGSNLWIAAWTANLGTGGVTFIVNLPDGSSTGETLGVSSCTIPIISEPDGLCSLDQISSLEQGIYKIQICFFNQVEVLEACFNRSFNVTLGTPITTPQPATPLDIKNGNNNAFGLISKPVPPVSAGKTVTLIAWTSNFAQGSVIFSIQPPGGSVVNTTVTATTCTIPVHHLTTGMCAMIQVGPVFPGTYVIESTFLFVGSNTPRSSIYESLEVV
jgi:hypothetical protein